MSIRAISYQQTPENSAISNSPLQPSRLHFLRLAVPQHDTEFRLLVPGCSLLLQAKNFFCIFIQDLPAPSNQPEETGCLQKRIDLIRVVLWRCLYRFTGHKPLLLVFLCWGGMTYPLKSQSQALDMQKHLLLPQLIS